jgi:hypothetical protein
MSEADHSIVVSHWIGRIHPRKTLMPTLAFVDHDVLSPTPLVRPGIAMVQVHDELWRLTRPDGDVLGYIERFAEPRGDRYRAKRLNALRRRFLVLGEFWSIDDAIDCFRSN